MVTYCPFSLASDEVSLLNFLLCIVSFVQLPLCDSLSSSYIRKKHLNIFIILSHIFQRCDFVLHAPFFFKSVVHIKIDYNSILYTQKRDKSESAKHNLFIFMVAVSKINSRSCFRCKIKNTSFQKFHLFHTFIFSYFLYNFFFLIFMIIEIKIQLFVLSSNILKALRTHGFKVCFFFFFLFFYIIFIYQQK